jgi:MFS family permease
MSLITALAYVPAALWAGWAIFGRAAGLVAAALTAVNPYMSAYAQEARMYTLLSLLGLLTAAAFVLAFVHRDRRMVVWFGAGLASMAYTHNWGLFFGFAAAVTLLALARRSPDRRSLLRDGALAFGSAAVIYLPWLPTLIGQALETGAPWARSPGPGAPAQTMLSLFGGPSAAVLLVAGAAVGIGALLRAPRRRAAAALLGLAGGTLALAWVASQVSPAWNARYFGTVLGPLILVAAAALTSGGTLGLAALVATLALWIPQPSATVLTNKANADVLAAELSPRLRSGDLVISMQPEQVPLLHYYLRPGLRYADARGAVSDPRVMDWRHALEDLRQAQPAPTFATLLSGVPRGGHMLFVAPVTEHRRDWRAPWTKLVRRRAAQWGALIEATPGLRKAAAAPQFYRESLTVGLHGVLYRRL